MEYAAAFALIACPDKAKYYLNQLGVKFSLEGGEESEKEEVIGDLTDPSVAVLFKKDLGL